MNDTNCHDGRCEKIAREIIERWFDSMRIDRENGITEGTGHLDDPNLATPELRWEKWGKRGIEQVHKGRENYAKATGITVF